MRQIIDKIASQLLRYIIPILALSLPLFFLPFTIDFFTTNKRLLLFTLTSIALVAWSVRNLTRKRLSITYSPSLLPLIGLSIIYILSSFLQTSNHLYSFLGQTSLIISLTLLFLTITSSQKNDSVIKLTISALSISAVVLSILSLLQVTGVVNQLTTSDWLKGKFFTPSGGPLPLIGFNLTLLPALIFLSFSHLPLRQRISHFVSSVIVLAGTIGQFSLLIPQTDQNRLVLLPLSAGWSIAVDVFKNFRTTLLGYGPENFITAFTRLRPTSLNLTPFWDLRFSTSSNEIITILSTAGLVAVILLIYAAIRLLTLSVHHQTSSSLKPYFRFVQITTLTTLIAFFIIPTTIILWTNFIISLILLTICLKLDNHHSIKDMGLNLYDQLDSEPKSGSYLLSLPIAILSIFGLLAFWKIYLPTYQASVISFGSTISSNKDLQATYNAQIKAYQLDPTNINYRLVFSKTSMAIANSMSANKDQTDADKNTIAQLVQQSIREAKNAAALEPNNVIAWENLSLIYRQLIGSTQGAPDWTLATYIQSILLDPTNARLRFEIGGIYYALGDYDNAIKAFEQAAERKPDWANIYYNLSASYKAKKDYPHALIAMQTVLKLMPAGATDTDKVNEEIKALQRLVTPTPSTETTDNPSDIKLVTPTPFPKQTKTPLPIPTDSAPSIPTPTP